MSMNFEKFIELRNRVADEVDIEKFIPVINRDESLDLHAKEKVGRWIRMMPLGEGIVFALMSKDSSDWQGGWTYREEDIPEVLEDSMRRILWN